MGQDVTLILNNSKPKKTFCLFLEFYQNKIVLSKMNALKKKFLKLEIECPYNTYLVFSSCIVRILNNWNRRNNGML